MIKYFYKYLHQGSIRSIEAKKNILGSFFVKLISILISLMLVPLTISYVNPSQYGIWLTLSSVIAWISFFDIGFTNGLRNKFAEAKAKGDNDLARKYVSTTYFYVGAIFIVVLMILLFITIFFDWSSFLNIGDGSKNQITVLSIIVCSYFCMQFVFRIIHTLLIADQKPALSALLDMVGQLLALICIYILTKFTSGSLIKLGLALGIAPTLVVILANLYLFNSKYKQYAPSIKFVKKGLAKDIINIGLKFFFIQIVVIIQYQSASFLIAHYFDTLQVTAYNIAYKYFGVLQMIFSIIVSPLWSCTTEAYNVGDHIWIRNAVKKYIILFFPFAIAAVVMLLLANWAYAMWLGKSVLNISFNISLYCCIFSITAMFATIFVPVINGISALRIQFISSIFTSIGFLFISIFLIKVCNMGVEAILIASIAANVYGYFIAPLQYYKIFIKESSHKIWYK